MKECRMRIVVLDGYTLNPGDLSWAALEAVGELKVYDRTPADLTLERAAEAEIILTNKTVLNAETMGKLPRLRYIGVLATGYNVVDIEAAAARKVPVTNVPVYGPPSVAQMTFAHLLNLTQHVAEHTADVRNGGWSRAIDWCYWKAPLIELQGLTMGIVGFGRIGRLVAELAHSFGMEVLAYDVVPPSNVPTWAGLVELNTLLRRSDVVTLHCPLTPQTKHLVNRERLALMKPTAFLINTSRGPLIDDTELAEALDKGVIAAAALDVLSQEPPPETNPLLKARNCYITPHIAWATRAARQRLMDTAVENVKAFVGGEPRNVINI
jgi:glycerate dehydrogenase